MFLDVRLNSKHCDEVLIALHHNDSFRLYNDSISKIESLNDYDLILFYCWGKIGIAPVKPGKEVTLCPLIPIPIYSSYFEKIKCKIFHFRPKMGYKLECKMFKSNNYHRIIYPKDIYNCKDIWKKNHMFQKWSIEVSESNKFGIIDFIPNFVFNKGDGKNV